MCDFFRDKTYILIKCLIKSEVFIRNIKNENLCKENNTGTKDAYFWIGKGKSKITYHSISYDI